ncbi:MAG: hypothetical protein PHN19_04840 [Patescibacteria group bacterium]|nr:hypothetical protein [Patescibacteria group bacterium]
MLATIKLTGEQLKQLVGYLNSPLNFLDNGKPYFEIDSFQEVSDVVNRLTLRINEPAFVVGLILTDLTFQFTLASTLY